MYDVLKRAAVFSAWHAKALWTVSAEARYHAAPPDRVLYQEGAPCECVWVLLAGSVHDGAGVVSVLRTLGSDKVDENGSHLATAVCLDDCRFATISYATFTSLQPELKAARKISLANVTLQSSSTDAVAGHGDDGARDMWYVGRQSRSRTERMVCAEEHGTFLVRQSGDGINFVICVNDAGSPMHFQIQAAGASQFRFADSEHSSLEDVIDFLRSQTLHGKSGNLLKLTNAATGGELFSAARRGSSNLGTAAASRGSLASHARPNVHNFSQPRAPPPSAQLGSPRTHRHATEPPKPRSRRLSAPAQSDEPAYIGQSAPVPTPLPPAQAPSSDTRPTHAAPLPSRQHSPRRPSHPHAPPPRQRPSPQKAPPPRPSTHFPTPRRRSRSFTHVVNRQPLGSSEGADASAALANALASATTDDIRTASNYARTATMSAPDSIPRSTAEEHEEHDPEFENRAGLFRHNSVQGNVSSSLHRIREANLEPIKAVSVDDDEYLLTPVVDLVQEALRKLPADRTEDENASVILDLQRLQTFSSMPAPIREGLCPLLDFLEYEQAGAEVASDSNASHYWWAVIQGCVEVEFGGNRANMVINEGSSFGLGKHAELCQGGMYVAGSDGCQVVRVTQAQYKAAEDSHASGQRTFKHNGAIQLITERQLLPSGEHGPVVVRGSPAYLLEALLTPAEFDIVGDTNYMDLYLLTSRTFCPDADLQHALLKAVENRHTAARVLKVVVKWVEQHRYEFLAKPSLVQFMYYLEAAILKNMPPGEVQDGLAELRNCRESVTVDRRVSISRPSTSVSLGLNIKGGRENMRAIFISGLVQGSIARNAALLTGDQILKLNGIDFDGVAHHRAVQVIKNSTQLDLVVRFNPTGFTNAKAKAPQPAADESAEAVGDGRKASGWKRAKAKMSLKKMGSRKRKSSKDIVPGNIFYLQTTFDGLVNEVVRVFDVDHSSHYVCILTRTTAKDIVELLQSIWSLSGQHTLFSVSIDSDGAAVACKLEDSTDDLMERLPPNARYYLTDEIADGKIVFSDEARADFEDSHTLVSLASDAVRPRDIARCLAFLDFDLFRSIPQLEYVHYLWRGDKMDGQCPNIDRMTDFHNRIRGWVVHEICSLTNVRQRVEMLRKFIKVARACHEVNNFNGLFAVLGALVAAPVSRLKQTWEKLARKYKQQHEDLEALMDPSRNMAKYRALLEMAKQTPPWVPFFPMVMKDITFLYDGNKNSKDGLVNVDKLRMLTHELSGHQVATKERYCASAMFAKKDGRVSSMKAFWQRQQNLRKIRLHIEFFETISTDEEMQLSYSCEASKFASRTSAALKAAAAAQGTQPEASRDSPVLARSSIGDKSPVIRRLRGAGSLSSGLAPAPLGSPLRSPYNTPVKAPTPPPAAPTEAGVGAAPAQQVRRAGGGERLPLVQEEIVSARDPLQDQQLRSAVAFVPDPPVNGVQLPRAKEHGRGDADRFSDAMQRFVQSGAAADFPPAAPVTSMKQRGRAAPARLQRAQRVRHRRRVVVALPGGTCWPKPGSRLSSPDLTRKILVYAGRAGSSERRRFQNAGSATAAGRRGRLNAANLVCVCCALCAA